jgi:hypothetical protein
MILAIFARIWIPMRVAYMRRERIIVEQKHLCPYMHACWFFIATHPSSDQLDGTWYGYQDQETRERRFIKEMVPSWEFQINITDLKNSKYRVDFIGRICQRSLLQCEWMR